YFARHGTTFRLCRTFVFFQSLLLGYWLTKEQVMQVKKKPVKITAVITMALVAIGIYVAPDFNSDWLLASESYGTLGLTEYGGFAGLLVYVTSTLLAISVFAWIPTERGLLTKLGARTLYDYMLLGVCIQYFCVAGLFCVDY